ncbi:ABC transporter ATP-binding protein [Hoyosella sp. G463]|uniref:Nickel import system ATP-binding protein NikD n=1 Tax=Lolliginicoccus lacisalsi TaxID=2742202 RepID=A0A927J990_9ACTN|nr:ABC transporter ATP-binding protein [Lolliginicoccus lacisalsi]MBD8504914.1 ABC transporter ATP-binding protein [Lolliginicoccus lacisalsi]
MPRLAIDDLTVRLALRDGRSVHALSEVTLHLRPGTITALIGESGCGKSILAAALMRLLPPTARVSGTARLAIGRGVIDALSPRCRRGTDIGLVPQSPATSFTPVRTVGSQIRETIAALGGNHEPRDLAERAGLPPGLLQRYPHELSGGQAQRAAIAAALAGDPTVLIADEPTSQLDPALASSTHRLLRELATAGTTILLISHDLAALQRDAVADRLAVMHASRIMEEGPAGDILADPWHDYTRDLLAALPERGLRPLPGNPVSLTDLPEECVYHRRNPATRQSGGTTALLAAGDRVVRQRTP